MSYQNFNTNDKKDWHDYEFMEREKARVGPGEQGKAHNPENRDRKLEADLYRYTIVFCVKTLFVCNLKFMFLQQKWI